MTQMIYRPQTNERLTLDRRQIHKTKFRHLDCDALVVDESEVSEYVKKGWFAHPDDMLKRKGKKNDDSNDDHQ